MAFKKREAEYAFGFAQALGQPRLSYAQRGRRLQQTSVHSNRFDTTEMLKLEPLIKMPPVCHARANRPVLRLNENASSPQKGGERSGARRASAYDARLFGAYN
jgi:hypothetical protein